MSSTPVTRVTTPLTRPAVRRVRHQAREAVALMAFSATTSVVLAGALVLLTHWGR